MAEDLLARRAKNLGDEYLMNKDDAEAIKEALTIPVAQRADMVKQMLIGFLESSPKKTPDLVRTGLNIFAPIQANGVPQTHTLILSDFLCTSVSARSRPGCWLF